MHEHIFLKGKKEMTKWTTFTFKNSNNNNDNKNSKLKTLNIQNNFQIAQSRHLRMYGSILLALFVLLGVARQSALKKTVLRQKY